VARYSKRIDYAVYPPDFHQRGVCWTFRRVSKARSKAVSLGVGSWIRRYVNLPRTQPFERNFRIIRLWLWNGSKFTRIREEPEFYKNPELEQALRRIRKP
jgi:hypothetical protein